MRTISIILCIGMSFCVNAQKSLDQLNKKIDSIYKTSKISGLAVSVMTQDEILYQNGFGYADVETKKKYTINTIQIIGSVSKTLIGVALMKAIEEEKLTINTPINDILPFEIKNPKYPEIPITVEHLATHTSSILDTDAYHKSYVLEKGEELKEENFTKREYKELKQMEVNKTYNLEDFLKNHLTPNGEWYHQRNFLKLKPGERYEYSNVGSALLAYIIEITTGTSFQEYTQQYILNPLKMESSGWTYEAIDKALYASTYTETGNKIPRYQLITYPDGGFRSNLKDLSKYLQGLMKGYFGKGTILKTSSFQDMMSPKLTKEQFNSKKELKDNYGFLWEVSTSGKIGHSGSDPGILTLMYFNKKDKIGAILFMNTGLEQDKDILRSVQNIWKSIKRFKKNYKETI